MSEELHTWVNIAKNGKKGADEAFDKIVDYMMPTIQQRVNTYARKSNIPKDILEIDAINNLQKAIHNFNPNNNNNATFKTFATHYIDKIRRTGYENANIGYIPEHRIRKINTFRKAQDALTRRLKRVPSSLELADELAWSVSEVDRMRSELRQELIQTEELQNIKQENDMDDIMHYIRFELQPDERVVYEHLTGVGVGREYSPQELAKKLDKPVEHVYNLKTRLTRKIKKILESGIDLE